jgi:hypothetical protein
MADHLARRHTAPLPGGLGTDLAQPTKDFRFVQRMVKAFHSAFSGLALPPLLRAVDAVPDWGTRAIESICCLRNDATLSNVTSVRTDNQARANH